MQVVWTPDLRESSARRAGWVNFPALDHIDPQLITVGVSLPQYPCPRSLAAGRPVQPTAQCSVIRRRHVFRPQHKAKGLLARPSQDQHNVAAKPEAARGEPAFVTAFFGEQHHPPPCMQLQFSGCATPISQPPESPGHESAAQHDPCRRQQGAVLLQKPRPGQAQQQESATGKTGPAAGPD
jgi:hypothetical protein